MSIRKRVWSSGETTTTAWIVDYTSTDPATGKRRRHNKNFPTKNAAREWWESHAAPAIRMGTHTAPSQSPTVAEAAELWLRRVELDQRERSTFDQYAGHVTHHVKPLLGEKKLADLTRPGIEDFRDQLLNRQWARDDTSVEHKISRTTAKKVLTSLKSVLREAQRRGLVAQNVAEHVRIDTGKRTQRRPEVGQDIPSPEEIRAILAAASGRWRPLIVTAIFTGLRASELRGLLWSNVDLENRMIRVRQRADKYGAIGSLKSASARRDIPLTPMVINTLGEWRGDCPKGELGLVFPTGAGKIESLGNIVNRGFGPMQIAAGVANDTGTKDDDGNRILKPKYGMHALRHFYASWQINCKSAGGLELPGKVVQTRLGHASIGITFDTYGHLFPDGDDHFEALAEAERALLS